MKAMKDDDGEKPSASGEATDASAPAETHSTSGSSDTKP
jgi:hypothetical protein